MKQANRVKTLEAKEPLNVGKSHRLICRPGQSIEEATAEYGLDKMAPGDLVIVRTIVDWPRRRD